MLSWTDWVFLCIEFVEVSCVICPASEVSLIQVKIHSFDPLADSLEFVASIIGVNSDCWYVSHSDRVSFGIEQNCLLWRIRIGNMKLHYEASLDT